MTRLRQGAVTSGLPSAAPGRKGLLALLIPDGRPGPAALAVPLGEEPYPGPGAAVVERIAVTGQEPRAAGTDRHLRVSLTGRPTGVPGRAGRTGPAALAGLADVLTARLRSGWDPCRAMAWAELLGRRNPGALVVLVHGGADGRVLLRTGEAVIRVHVASVAAAGPARAVRPLWGSVLHAWLTAGVPLPDLLPATVQLSELATPPLGAAGVVAWRQTLRLVRH